jgi:questin oxidase-like protein
MPSSFYEPLDDALDLLSGYGSALANGNFNHAPMVAEALCSLGRPAAVMPWLERYRPRLLPCPIVGQPVTGDAWQGALGRVGSFTAWCEFFADQLAAAEWRQVLDRWVARLAPGASAAATHGVIRVGHAVRALAVGESQARRRELGDALASWAANYRQLPSAPAEEGAKLPPRAALAAIPVVPPDRRRPGSITVALSGLADVSAFAPAVAAVDLGGDRAARLAELGELFARLYLANARDVPSVIAFIHGVTSLAAIGHIVPHVADETAHSLIWYGWQAGCGLFACYGRPGGDAAGVTDWAPRDETADSLPDSLTERALANGDEHVIKFTEACLARHRIAPSPVYPAAIDHVLHMIVSR